MSSQLKPEASGTRPRQSFTGRLLEETRAEAHRGPQVQGQQRTEPCELGSVLSVGDRGDGKTAAAWLQGEAVAERGVTVSMAMLEPEGTHAGR